MKAAVVTDFKRPLEIEDVPSPSPGPARSGQDRGQRPLPHRHPRRPRRLAGQAHAAVHPRPRGRRHRRARSAQASQARGGDRVAVPWLGYACGDCRYCISGWETLCDASRTRATTIDGGYAEYAIGYARYVVRSPTGSTRSTPRR